LGWKKKGRIFVPENQANWFGSHAATPVTEVLSGDLIRVYFSGRDIQNRAQIGFFEIDVNDPHNILRVSNAPVIPIGPLGSFEDSGVISCCLVNREDKDYFYYAGLTLGQTVPFFFFGALAVRQKGSQQFVKLSPAPIMGRHQVDPYLVGQSYVMVEDNIWRMWYVSCTHWEATERGPKHYYLIKYAESLDGIDWQRTGRICIDFANASEYAIAKPWVIKEDGIYKMWYCYRGVSYRIGYAESKDGLEWERKDNFGGLEISESGWDSEMTAYPYLLDHRGQRYLFYNGNGYGKTGVGLAIWEMDEANKL
jgi:hypothetical protein